MTGELDKVGDARPRRSRPTGARRTASSRNELRRQHEGLHALTEHTAAAARGARRARRCAASGASAWPRTCCASPGFLEGVNYRKQATLAGTGGPPRLHVPAAERPRDAHGREVPARQLRALPRGDNRPRAQAAPRPVPPRRARPRAGADDARLPRRADETVDCLLLFIPNEQVYAFVQEHDRAMLDDALRAQDRAVLAAHALRGARGRAPGGRQLPARAHVERDPRAARRVLAAVGEVRRRSSTRCSSASTRSRRSTRR